MRRIFMVLPIGIAAIFLLASPVVGQDDSTAAARPERTHGKFSLGGGIGVFQPVGSWADHRYAPGINQFTRGFTAEAVLEYQLADWVGLGGVIGGGGLGTGEWVDYAASMGSDVTASAKMFYLAALVRLYLLNRPKYMLKLDLGGGTFGPTGQESYLYFTYDYNFLKSQGLALIGLEYCLFVKPKLALAGRASLFIAADGVEYADGLKRTIYGLPITVGLRFYP